MREKMKPFFTIIPIISLLFFSCGPETNPLSSGHSFDTLSVKDTALNYNTYDKYFDTFGVLEVAGYCIALKNEIAYHLIHENPKLYKEALDELNS